ncbi:endonuclease/exonuclease/phosphatase family protein [Roseovarius sp. SCSIO 43702]|uniref:endonuclease/exonuclease/phosphatase family protein n=1 Tax=Roseovarius sp. SCSIO 43702 TaxID=2823043 RepID=UPI001C73C505|nr:endonuclease/exonuclease/phosphatase family protein [Roseovarius sp. SCSIO 43702]QYX55884.1 endonuclease/exonuclease/phosphatase family protein [Roseovarius sp. SCSIO 43702]
MRIATYNIEWFNALFDDAGRLLDDGGWSARRDVTRSDQIAAIGTVLTALDADAIMVIEAPDQNSRRSTVRALEGFAAAMGLRARAAVLGFPNDTQQEIAMLHDPDALSVAHDPQGGAGAAPRFDGSFRIDLDIDATEDVVTFSKPPLELAARTASGTAIRMIGVHLKSKAPHGATTEAALMRIGIANRRKQLAQAIWLRARVAEHLALGEPVILMGDLNDGPGLDEYENLFGRSSVEIVMGEGQDALFDPHARDALTRRIGPRHSTSRFYLADTRRYMQALLDYIMVSPDLCAKAPHWRIWHPFDDPDCWRVPELREALLTASDHFPVTLDIDI